MTKQEMLKEITFPILGNETYNFYAVYFQKKYVRPPSGVWTMVLVELKGGTRMTGIYKWQKENNPENIVAWATMDIHAKEGDIKYVEYQHLHDENIILICNEKQKDFIIKSE